MRGWSLTVLAMCVATTDGRGSGESKDTDGGTISIRLPGAPEGTRPMQFVLIRPGSFRMGCPGDERGRVGREWPLHQVTLTRSFYLGRNEVTQAQWKAVMGVNPANGHGVGDEHPAHDLTWNDGQKFIARLNTLGLGTFRMPTEAEWEYACRAGTTTRFSFGHALECSDVREFCPALDLHLWWGGNNGKNGYPSGCKAVGLKAPNAWGLYDMHGNVWEWCSDWWQGPEERGAQTNPKGPAQGTHKVMRGGAWESHALHLRSADRSPMAPEDREYGRLIGLRLVRD